ncbi:hypothetical protein [Saccharospirillum alexandrii]|uniref:hypothetical protein n=1 Tax=Saccharospirillum alexandrii TaxID=2448477 RepID=UPI0037360498
MNIEKLSEYVYEDLNGFITRVDLTNDLVIHFQCDDIKEIDVIRKFTITCHDVIESDVQPGFTGVIDFLNEHQLLWKHNAPQGYLYYSSEAENHYDLLGRLWETHEKLVDGWRQFSETINTRNAGIFIEFCKDSNGLLAQGPKPLLDKFQETALKHLKTNYVPSITPEGGYKALVFDCSFVICKAVTVNELTS